MAIGGESGALQGAAGESEEGAPAMTTSRPGSPAAVAGAAANVLDARTDVQEEDDRPEEECRAEGLLVYIVDELRRELSFPAQQYLLDKVLKLQAEVRHLAQKLRRRDARLHRPGH